MLWLPSYCCVFASKTVDVASYEAVMDRGLVEINNYTSSIMGRSFSKLGRAFELVG